MTGAFYMDALITPARSLARRGRYTVLAAMGAMALIPAIVFTLMGAPFILPFMGLDVAGLALAFWVVSRRTSAEQVRIRLLEASHGGTVPVDLDLGGVVLFSSSAVRVVLAVARIARDEDWRLGVHAEEGGVTRHILEISGLAGLVDLR